MLLYQRFFLILLISGVYACSGPEKSAEHAADLIAFNEAAFATKGPKDFYSWSADRIPLVSAHRGGPYPGYPENAIETFEHIIQVTPSIIECDIEMTKDSVLIMMHDNTLDRTTTGTGKVRDQYWSDLQKLKLTDLNGDVTDYKIPTLKEVLNWSKGKALLTLDVKRGVPFEMVINEIQETNTQSYAAIITYNADAAKKVYELDPSLMISVGVGTAEGYEAHNARGIPNENMIAFMGLAEPDPEQYDALHEKGIFCILGVLGNLDKKAMARGDSIYAGFVKRGADILATDRPKEAAAAIKELIPETSTKRKYFNGH